MRVTSSAVAELSMLCSFILSMDGLQTRNTVGSSVSSSKAVLLPNGVVYGLPFSFSPVIDSSFLSSCTVHVTCHHTSPHFISRARLLPSALSLYLQSRALLLPLAPLGRTSNTSSNRTHSYVKTSRVDQPVKSSEE
uniref:Secreted protein n=1 Tax=Salix viminalis TaxID=40686 RepID=A0A6N2NM68_SALVM